MESGCSTLGRGQPETFTYGASNVEKKYISILKAYEPIAVAGIGSFLCRGGWRDLLALLPLGIGAAAGILLLTKPLAALMKRYPSYCNFALLGFGVGSLKALVAPCIGHPQIGYLLWFQIANGLILGAGAVWGILKLNQRKINGDAPQ